MSNHSFDILIAEEYKSADIAILVWHFQYWIMKNKRLGRNQVEGKTWTYQTLEEIASAFPYWSFDQVRRLLKKVIDLKILITGNFNKQKFDRTTWYAFENEEKFGIWRFRQMEVAKVQNGNGGSATPIPDTLPNTLTDKEGEEAPPPPRAPRSPKKEKKENPEKKAYRDQILLTSTEYEKLLSQYGYQKLNWMLDHLEAKKGANGYQYESDYHVLLPANWVNGEYTKQLNGGKIENIASSPTASFEKNKKICEYAEQKLSNLFTGHVFFQAGSTSATLIHMAKDLKKIYNYESFESSQLKDILIRDLESTFPNARQLLLGVKNENKITSLIQNLKESTSAVHCEARVEDSRGEKNIL